MYYICCRIERVLSTVHFGDFGEIVVVVLNSFFVLRGQRAITDVTLKVP